ncbi:NADPH-dependent aldehyde reductase-like protein, chloroplastic [Papaver somniferum]|uniref:NADPH-dependent aldehyde reductase-like protein, chloroplastic n=1 Tax=Papaver somniferum TaxID=3469 RepID=UPI000E6F8C9D|nr:NADPH-dependent aldehyde reductase-like protein, chloroplastic [Papaver somniferum]
MALDNANAIPSSSSLPLENRVAIITGASGGIGGAIARHLASLGAKLVLSYSSNSTQTDLLATELNNSSSSSQPKAISIKANVSDPDQHHFQVKSLFDHAEKVFNSQPHILVNSAGVLDPKYPTISNTNIEDFDHIFNINTKGAFLCAREAANRLVRGGGRRIILISSSMVGGLKPGFGAYAASKAAVETMMRILAKELKGTGITANCVAPGPIATDMFYAGKGEVQIKNVIAESPLSRLGETKDVAPVVGFLAGDASEWVNGQVIRVNGGYV